MWKSPDLRRAREGAIAKVLISLTCTPPWSIRAAKRFLRLSGDFLLPISSKEAQKLTCTGLTENCRLSNAFSHSRSCRKRANRPSYTFVTYYFAPLPIFLRLVSGSNYTYERRMQTDHPLDSLPTLLQLISRVDIRRLVSK